MQSYKVEKEDGEKAVLDSFIRCGIFFFFYFVVAQVGCACPVRSM